MDKNSWNKFVIEHGPRSGAFLQSWEWGEFQKSIGREVRRYETHEAIAQVISHPLPGGFYGWTLYRGPIGIKNQSPQSGIPPAGESRIMETIISDLKKTKGIFFHIEPNQKPQATSRKLQAVPNRQPQHTLILDLRKHEELLLSEMHEKTRYNIRLAERHSVAIKENVPTEDFLKLMKETTARDGFSPHPESYYREMLKNSLDTKLFVAYHNNEPLAAAIINFFGNTATYLHGASSNEKRNLMTPYLLHWHIMQSAKSQDCAAYDFWGISPNFADAKLQADKLRPRHPWAGITRFKKGFGGEIIIVPGALELPLRLISYKIYKLLKCLRP